MMNQKLDCALEVKALEGGEFEGHGSVFRNVDEGGDIVVPGAFERTLTAHENAGVLPQMFWMHQPDKVPGRWMAMAEDDEGLRVKGELAPTPLGREMRTLLSMRAVRGLSIGFRTVDSDFDKQGHRLLKEIDLVEVSIVSLAMNPLAKIEQMKARLSEKGEYVPTERELEQSLRDVGCSKRIAQTILSRIYDDDVDPGGIPDGRLRDSGVTTSDEEREAAAALDRISDLMFADLFRQ